MKENTHSSASWFGWQGIHHLLQIPCQLNIGMVSRLNGFCRKSGTIDPLMQGIQVASLVLVHESVQVAQHHQPFAPNKPCSSMQIADLQHSFDVLVD